jgi:multidrug efflux pump subunit AcrA (membrane-fusion protein)
MEVHQRQELFYLPDLTEMEVEVALNESMIDRIRTGLRAAVRFEALPKLLITGEVVSVGQIPMRQRVGDSKNNEANDVNYFTCIVKLDEAVQGLKPGMSAMVDIALSRRNNVIAVAHRALRSDRGRKVCFVAHDEALDRRLVKIGQETTDLVEVTDGLEEGELVVLDPPNVGSRIEPLLRFDPIDPESVAEAQTVAASRQ